ncbi:MAG: sigma factor-like helix-turn-helix DNA-binding protein [Myxococcales bacterium]
MASTQSLPRTAQSSAASERGLVRRIVQQDRGAAAASRAALASLIHQRGRLVFRSVRAISGAQAERVTCDVWLEAYRAFMQNESYVDLSTWLGRRSVQLALRQPRLRRSVPPLEPAEEVGGVTPQAADPLVAMLERCLDQLPLDQRIVFTLARVEQLSIAQVAACLGMSDANVQLRLRRAQDSWASSGLEELHDVIPQVYAFDAALCQRVVQRVLRNA